MSNVKLDIGMTEGNVVFDSATNYLDGERRWAVRGNWFVRFWGYVFTKLDAGSVPAPGTNRVVLFFDRAQNRFRYRTGGVIYNIGDSDGSAQTSTAYTWFTI